MSEKPPPFHSWQSKSELIDVSFKCFKLKLEILVENLGFSLFWVANCHSSINLLALLSLWKEVLNPVECIPFNFIFLLYGFIPHFLFSFMYSLESFWFVCVQSNLCFWGLENRDICKGNIILSLTSGFLHATENFEMTKEMYQKAIQRVTYNKSLCVLVAWIWRQTH